MKTADWLKYMRIKIFESALKPFSVRRRRVRMRLFSEVMMLKPTDRVLDLGGHPDIWDFVDVPLRITILNLPGNVIRKDVGPHEFSYVEGDACNVVGFTESEFDLVYSNSVIEHVGDESKQSEFAAQVRKFNAAFWIQTPSKWFPIEAHCGMPFWWFYPSTFRSWWITRWRPKLPAWTEMVEGTRVLEKSKLEELFPDSRILTERYLGIPKSYIVVRKTP